jgi:hypothetical protein
MYVVVFKKYLKEYLKSIPLKKWAENPHGCLVFERGM